jgi:CHAT domain-containing protein
MTLMNVLAHASSLRRKQRGIYPQGIEKYATINLPSLRFFNPEKHLQSLKPSQGISCVDPAINGSRLPFQQETNTRLANLLQERLTPLVGRNCSPKRLETAIQNIHSNGFLHIGAHGRFYDPDPMLSRITLASDEPDGKYAYWDAQAMGSVKLNKIHLVTLSSCETGLKSGRYPRDMFGILRALFYGGAHNVIAPLWSVQDRATSRLIQAFYSHYTTNGRLAQALQQAQQSMIRNPKFRHPFYWSGFVLTGGPV